jgi:hypothetical protein
MPTEAFCSLDAITTLTKLLAEAKNQGVIIVPGKFKFDPKSEKRYIDLAKDHFEKP